MDPPSGLSAPPPLDAFIARGPIALFLDFDGTLVELAHGPDAIAPLPDLAQRLVRLAERMEGRCAIISGRGIADIERHVGSLSVAVAGSHGLDRRRADGSALCAGPQALPEAIAHSLRVFADENGLAYEHKPHGGALHTRAKPDLFDAAKAHAEDLATEHGWVVQGGKHVVEVVARGANKGAALDAFMAEKPFAGAQPVFLGDDLTDEAGFAAAIAQGGEGILIGHRQPSTARLSLPDVAAVHTWLQL
jgi:trehalose 6-phosphate phosphatase